MPNLPLNKLRVLVTRPVGQADNLIQLIEQAGGDALHVPLLSMQPRLNAASVMMAKQQLKDYDLILFISANAVRFGLQALGKLPDSAKLAAVGYATANALAEHGYRRIIHPQTDFSSEGLLALDEFQSVAQKKVLIVRGEGGRKKLKQALTERGATVDYAECYAREPAAVSEKELIRIQQADVIASSSAHALDHLADIGRNFGVLERPVLPVSPRMADKAKQLGFKQVLKTAANASDSAILEALCAQCAQIDIQTPSLETTMSENQNDKNPSTNTSPAKTDPVAKAPATSSKADTAKKPAPKKAKKEKAGGGFAKLLALLALIIAAGASGYGWFELQKIKQQLGEQATAVENFAGSSAMTKLKEGIYHRIDGFNKDQQSMQRQLTGLEEAVSMAVVEKNRDQRGWVLAEAEYLMSMANSRLRLLRDVKSATEALKGADMRIASLADPSLLPVQEALAEEISDLQAIGVMDANRIAMKLMYISKLVRKMPPAQVILGSEGSASDDDINPAIASLLSKIGIQKNQRPFDARPQQIDIMSMDQKLLMDLDAARHAVLRFDEKTYTSHINSARETIQQHYDMENEQVSIVDGELRDMNARKIFPTLPDISGSSIALNKARALYEPAKANKE